MIPKTLILTNQLGLHARASAKLSDLATRFRSKITVDYKGRALNVKDILNVISLGSPCGTSLTFTFEGEDEIEAAKAIEQLITEKFGEEN
ncbi:MAG TPA: HPr family phosphocarrier protein [Coxiellaceae bacterium]|nr:HPr family phosphocarrier protein [Coxiellaceae bacterium]